MSSPDSFGKFSELPRELRLLIWAFASRAPRSIELMYAWVNREFLHLKHAPAVLHTCSESRAVAQTFYNLSFGTTNHPPKIYFNPVEDIVYFGSRQFDDEISFTLDYFRNNIESLAVEDKIQRIAIAAHHWKRFGSPLGFPRSSSSSRRFLNSFPSIKELIFVHDMKNIPTDLDHIEDFVEGLSQTYPGLSLARCPASAMDSLDERALKEVLASVDAQKQTQNGLNHLEVLLMEYVTW